MSIKKLCSRDSVIIKRLETVYDTNFGTSTKTWTTDARGSLPTVMTCRIQPAQPEDLIGYAVRGFTAPLKAYFSEDPQMDEKDHVIWNGNEYEVAKPPLDFDSQSRLFKSIIQRWTIAE